MNMMVWVKKHPLSLFREKVAGFTAEGTDTFISEVNDDGITSITEDWEGQPLLHPSAVFLVAIM